MKNLLRQLINRSQPLQSTSLIVKAGIGGLLAIAAVAWGSHATGSPLLMAPFGASCVLLFSVPASPLSQPANLVGGHLVSTLIGLIMQTHLPLEWWALALSVGLAIAAMAALRITHPPAGADPLVIFFESPGLSYILFPALFGSLVLVLIAWLIHRLPPRTPYPLTLEND